MGLLTWPFKVVGTIIALTFGLLGSILSAVVGIVMAAVGLFFSLTVVGAVIGIPLMLFGILLLLKALF